jgi:hypothetical protein
MNLVRPAVAVFAVMCAGVASAATVTVYGNNVSFTYDDATEYGVGIVVGDAILFTPTGIISESEDGAGLVTTTKMLNIQVEVLTAGYWLQDFHLIEQGDYQLDGAGATADMNGIFQITSNTSSYTALDNFDAGPLTVQNSLTEWTAGSMISLADTAGWGADTDIDIDLTNTLTASTSASGEYAMVQKKLGAVSIEITAVPVPAAVWLFGSGLGLLGWMRHRRTA